MDYQNLLFEVEDGIGVLTINRPNAMNALNAKILDELNRFCDTMAVDESVKLIIITGAGSKAFVAGADIAEMHLLDAAEAVRFSQWGQSVFNKIESLPKPVIAAVNGYALGGGCELAMACDIRIASDNAKFGQPEVSLGIIAGYGGTQRLPRLVGSSVAKEMLFTGDSIDANEAYRIGLVNRVVSARLLIDAAKSIGKKILSRGPVAVGLTKTAIDRGLEGSLTDGFNIEAELFGACFATADQKNAMKAFLTKSIATFIGS